jgi:hypothetical protein
MAKRRSISEFPQNVIGDQRLPSRIVVNQRPDMLQQEVRSDCHLIVLVVEQAAFHDTSCGISGWSAVEIGFDLRMIWQEESQPTAPKVGWDRL